MATLTHIADRRKPQAFDFKTSAGWAKFIDAYNAASVDYANACSATDAAQLAYQAAEALQQKAMEASAALERLAFSKPAVDMASLRFKLDLLEEIHTGEPGQQIRQVKLDILKLSGRAS